MVNTLLANIINGKILLKPLWFLATCLVFMTYILFTYLYTKIARKENSTI